MTDIHTGPDGCTPLDPDERDGLIPMYIATREELNAAEQANIAAAVLGLRPRRLTTAKVLEGMFVRSLHTAMYGDVSKWAAGTGLRNAISASVRPRSRSRAADADPENLDPLVGFARS